MPDYVDPARRPVLETASSLWQAANGRHMWIYLIWDSNDTVNPPALERLLAEGVSLKRFSDDIMQAAHDASFDLFEEQAAADPGYRAVYESWSSARRAAYRWFDTAEAAFAAFAFSRVDG